MGGKYHARCGPGPYTGGSWIPGSVITQALIEAKLVQSFPSVIPGCPVQHPQRGAGSAPEVCERLKHLGLYTSQGDSQFVLDLNETTDDDLASIGIDAAQAGLIRSFVAARKGLIQSQGPTQIERKAKSMIKKGSDVQRLLAHARLVTYNIAFQKLGVKAAADFADVSSHDLMNGLDMGVVQRRRFHLMLQSIAEQPPPKTRNFTMSPTHMQDHVVGFLQHRVRFSRRMIVGLDWDHGQLTLTLTLTPA